MGEMIGEVTKGKVTMTEIEEEGLMKAGDSLEEGEMITPMRISMTWQTHPAIVAGGVEDAKIGVMGN